MQDKETQMKLTHEEAVNKLLRHSHHCHKAYLRLIAWDSEKTLTHNARALGITYAMAILLARAFLLNYKMSTAPRGNKRGKLFMELDQVRSLRAKGFTYQAIGQLYGVSRQRVEGILATRG